MSAGSPLIVTPTGQMPPLLTDADFAAAARQLVCDVAAIHAVSDVESAGGGFLEDGRPKILYESHQFHHLTQGKWDASHPDISTPTWVRNYKGGAAEYDRLEIAKALNEAAALESASWGRYQIMGLNFRPAGFESVQDFVAAMQASEANHLAAFVSYLKAENIAKYLGLKDWASFAFHYNGTAYRANRYDTKLAEKYAGEHLKYGG